MENRGDRSWWGDVCVSAVTVWGRLRRMPARRCSCKTRETQKERAGNGTRCRCRLAAEGEVGGGLRRGPLLKLKNLRITVC